MRIKEKIQNNGEIYIGDGKYMELKWLKKMLKETGYKIVKIHKHNFDDYMGFPYGKPSMKLYRCKCGEEKFKDELKLPIDK